MADLKIIRRKHVGPVRPVTMEAQPGDTLHLHLNGVEVVIVRIIESSKTLDARAGTEKNGT